MDLHFCFFDFGLLVNTIIVYVAFSGNFFLIWWKTAADFSQRLPPISQEVLALFWIIGVVWWELLELLCHWHFLISVKKKYLLCFSYDLLTFNESRSWEGPLMVGQISFGNMWSWVPLHSVKLMLFWVVEQCEMRDPQLCGLKMWGAEVQLHHTMLVFCCIVEPCSAYRPQLCTVVDFNGWEKSR